MSNIKISIITVSLNSEKYIESTILSVANQTYKNKEHIIIDGGSSDLTTKIIGDYQDYFSYWISEPDDGIAEAMNKGIDIATGDYILFLNSDDYFIDETALERGSKYLEDFLDIYVFQVMYLYDDGRELISNTNPLGLLTNFKMGSSHQGQLISRDLFNRIGKYDQSLEINFDYDFILRAYRYGASARSIEMLISVMRQVGISSRRDWLGFKNRYDEERLIHFNNCKGILCYIIYKIYWLLYIPYRRFRYSLIFLNKKYLKNKTNKYIQ